MSTVNDIQDHPEGVYPLPRLNANNGVVRELLAQALTSAPLFATSTTSRAIGIGIQTFTTEVHRSFLVGVPRIRISDSGDQNRWMEGKVTSYSGTSLSVAIDKISGSGTNASWTISVAGEPGASAENGGLTPETIEALNGVVAGAISNDDLFVLLDVSTDEVKSLAASVLKTWISAFLGSAATKNVGSGANEVAAGNHSHSRLTLGAGSASSPTLEFPASPGGKIGLYADGDVLVIQGYGASNKVRIGNDILDVSGGFPQYKLQGRRVFYAPVEVAAVVADEFSSAYIDPLNGDNRAVHLFGSTNGLFTLSAYDNGRVAVGSQSVSQTLAKHHIANSDSSIPCQFIDLAPGQTGVVVALRSSSGVQKFMLYADGGVECAYTIKVAPDNSRWKEGVDNTGARTVVQVF